LLLFVLPNYISDPKLNYLLQFGFGLFAIVAAASSSGGIGSFLARQGNRYSDRLIGPAGDRVEDLHAAEASLGSVWTIPVPTTHEALASR
jgi:hypothetical protein